MVSSLKTLLILLLLQCIVVTKTYADDKVVVFVSILPQQFFVQEIGKDLVDVRVMVGPGQNPATYEPTPQQMAALSKADVYFRIGVPFESAWLDKIKLNNENLKIVECCESISNLNDHGHSHEHGHDYDPHVWTSPKKVLKIAELIKNSLIEIDNKNSTAYEASERSFNENITELDEVIKNKTKNIKNRMLIVSHSSWSYFADEYGFTQVSIEQGGKEIQASSMVSLIKTAKEKNVKTIFVQPQFNDRAAKVIANELKAEIIILDPLAFNYIENMNMVADSILKGLAHD
ncbi:MAG: cation ABC transporter substrate-binding protein [marine bacterium B5-7]|nr:MAG: cation ABC transporter substrate-binding protein [marine bacterium B5-7]